MAISTKNLDIIRVGPEGHHQDLPVDGGTHIYKGTMLSALTTGGMHVPTTTALSGHCVAVATHEQDASTVADGVKHVRGETDRDFIFPNDVTNPFSEASKIGAIAYAVDDHTVATTGTIMAGTFRGMDPNGVRINVSPTIVQIAAALLT